MSAELFIEIGAEEIPAAEVMPAVGALRDALVAGLDAKRLAHGEAKVHATPRRLAVIIPGVDARQKDETREVIGPPVKAAFKDGQPTKAAEGFAKQNRVAVDALVRRETPKGEYLFAVVEEKGRAAAELLPELMVEAIAKIPFKRTMRWGYGDTAFIRPIQWIVGLFGGEVVRFSYAGVESGRTSKGHRFLAPEAFEVRDGAQWLAELAKRHVVADVAERRAAIVRRAAELAASVGGRVRTDEGLVDEVVQLVEKPVPLLAEFDRKYLEIPQEVLISEMREHQRYLSIIDAQGKLLPSFVVVANTELEDPSLAIDGYKRVLTSRFEDGVFFFNEDQKVSLSERVKLLKDVEFQRALGTIHDKVERVVRLAFFLASRLVDPTVSAPADAWALAGGPSERTLAWKLARAGYLMKADLTTKMVFEFPALQGTMGRAYAEKAGEDPEVAAAIEEHYQPRNAGDAMPKGVLGALLGMADRLDTITGIFSTGKQPTGAADPFGLRRAALGIINVLRDRKWHLSLDEAIASSIALLGARSKKDPAELAGEVGEFFRGRLKAMLTVPGDVAEAALSAGYSDVVDAEARAVALAGLRQRADFEPVAITFKRVANILKDQRPGEVGALSDPAEKKLFETAKAVREKVEKAIAARDFTAAITVIAEVRPVVDAFFDAVMVMDPDPAVRANRVALVGWVHRIFSPLADFTKLS